MDRNTTIMGAFFENPSRGFQIRELSRLLKANHATIRKYAINLEKEELIEIIDNKPWPYLKARINKKFLNFKLFYNLEKLRKSGLIEQIEKDYDYPVIVMFGSYASATDDKNSDIDLFVLTDIKKGTDYSKFERKLNRKITIHLFSKDKFNLAKNKNPDLLNSIINGFTLSGKLEVFK
jgi:predicted nucleotidyltransferase